MDFKLLPLLPLLIFLPHISFSCKNPVEEIVSLIPPLPPCTFGDGDPGQDKDIPIARQMLSPKSSKYKIHITVMLSIHFYSVISNK